MNTNMKKSKLILLATILLTMSVFASACAIDGGYGAVQGGAGAAAPTEIEEPDEDNTEWDDAISPEDDELIYDHDALFGTDETEENDMMDTLSYYFSITGIVESIEETENGIRVTIEDINGNPAVLVISKNTVFPFDTDISEGDTVTAWYATNRPMIMIWPPQYTVEVLSVNAPEGSNIKVDRFETMEGSDMMLSQDQMFAFDVGEETEIILADGTDFTDGDIEGRRIVVIYGRSTRSIPEQATATKLIVLFEDIVPLG